MINKKPKICLQRQVNHKKSSSQESTPSASLSALVKDLRDLKDESKSNILQRFFKTGPGQYGEGDVFWGIAVPISRRIAKKYSALSFLDVEILLKDKIHELRLVALLILVDKYQKAFNNKDKAAIVNFYLKNTKYINNWDLVDLSVYKIVGDYLLLEPSKLSVLDKLALSKNIWERRIAIVATYAFIKKGRSEETFKIAEQLLGDKHDLIHKAVGWMLREVGKRIDRDRLRQFLDKNLRAMPRTALRYSLEHFPENERREYLRR